MRYRIMLIELSPSGGLFQFGFQLGSAMARAGHDVRLVTGPDPELRSDEARLEVDDSLPTWHAGERAVKSTALRKLRRAGRAVRHVMALLTLLRTIATDKPDVVFFQPLRFAFDAWMVRICGVVSPRTRRVLVLHEPRPLSEQRRSGSLYKRAPFTFLAQRGAIRSLDMVLVLGEQSRQDTLDIWRPRGPVVVVPHGDEGIFRDDSVLVPVSETGPVCLFFGIWTRHKGLDLLLEAFAQVTARVPGARLVVCGSVTGDVDLAHLQALAAGLDGVELQPGYVDIADVPALFGQARVVVVPYLRAAQSGVVHLAQTFERPVVATAVGDVPEVVPHGEAGLIVPVGDPQALALALVELLLDPQRAHAMGVRGRQRLEDSASWDDVASAVLLALSSPTATHQEVPRG